MLTKISDKHTVNKSLPLNRAASKGSRFNKGRGSYLRLDGDIRILDSDRERQRLFFFKNKKHKY